MKAAPERSSVELSNRAAGDVSAHALRRAAVPRRRRAPRCASQIAGYLLHSGGIPKETART